MNMKRLKSKTAVILLVTMMCFSILLSANLIEIYPAYGLNQYVYVGQVGTPGAPPVPTSPGTLFGPSGLAVNSLNNLYVAEGWNYRVSQFDYLGNFVRMWGSYGTGFGQFEGPSEIAVDGSGSVYVSEYTSVRVEKFSSNGDFIRQWGSQGTGQGQFGAGPRGIAIDSLGDVYVADVGNNRIEKFSGDGAFITQWGSMGTGPGQFQDPWGVAVDSQGNVYVADHGNNRVQKFSSIGTFLAELSGSFGDAVAIAVDGSDNLYVLDNGLFVVQKFSSDGTPVASWSCGSGYGIAVDSSGVNVYVADTVQSQIRRYQFDTPYTLTINKNPVGVSYNYVLPYEGSGPYVPGSVVTITAVATHGYIFTGWSGDLSGITNPTTITIDADKVVTANFVEPFQASYSTGSPYIDGALSTGEWIDATGYPISLSGYQGQSGTPVSPVPATVYFKHDGTNMYLGLEVNAIGLSGNQFLLSFDEGDDGAYGRGTRDGVLTPYQEDSKACSLAGTIDGYFGETDGAPGPWIGATSPGDFVADCAFNPTTGHWEVEFSIPFAGYDGPAYAPDFSDLVYSVMDTIGIKIQYFTTMGDGINFINYYYPAGDKYQAGTFATLSFEHVTVTPNPALLGQSVTVNGHVVGGDLPLSIRLIDPDGYGDPDGYQVATATTDIYGQFQVSVAAPAKPGTFYVLIYDTSVVPPSLLLATDFELVAEGLSISNIVDVAPSLDWSYLLMHGETVVREFTLPAEGGSISLPSLTPDTYWIAQTDKLRYNNEGVAVNGVDVTTTKENNFTYVNIDLLAGDALSVVFNNALIPDIAFAKPAPAGGGDSSQSSANTYTMLSRVAVPVQVSWDPDIAPLQELDVVKDRPTKIMVNLADLLTSSNPLERALGSGESVTVTVTCSPGGFFANPLSYAETRSGADIATNNVLIFNMNPPSTIGHYTITCTTTLTSGGPISTLNTLVKVRETSLLYLYYSHLYRTEYRNELDVPGAYDTMVTNTKDFVKAVYPVPDVTVVQDTVGIAGAATEPNYVGMLKDCQAVEVAAKQAFFNSPNVIGVAIGPDLALGGNYKNYFKYHGAISGSKVAVGVSFGPAVKGVIVSDGYYSAAAHEIAHTFGLYYGVPEQYTQFNPGTPANGFWVDQNQWRSGYDFMGLSTLRSTTSTWTSTDTTFEPLFASLKTTADPQIILVNGIIWNDGRVDRLDLPDQWYKFPYGIPDTVPTGKYAIRFTLKDGSMVERSFAAQFFLNLDPGVEMGEDLPGDFTGFGTIPVDFAGFAFATEYPANTDPTHSIEVVDNTNHNDPKVIGEIAPTSVENELPGGLSAQFGGFMPPLKSGTSYKSGNAVPVKFQLKSSTGAFITNAQPTLYLIRQYTTTEIAATSTGGSSIGNLFGYNAANNQYEFNLATKTLTKTTYQLKVYLGDGTTKTINIVIK